MANSAVNVSEYLGAGNYASTVFWQDAIDSSFRFSRSIGGRFDADFNQIIATLTKVSGITLDSRRWDDDSKILASNNGDALILCNHEDFYFSFQICASSLGVAEAWLAAISDMLPEFPPEPEVPYSVPLTYWLNTAMGPSSFRRVVESQPWSDISGNYPPKTASSVNRLATLQGFDEGGKLVLLHGHPGTGKTRAILGLAETWRQWANVNIITDPDQFFGDSAYMLNVVMGANPDKWNIIIIEDGDEFMDAADSGRKSQSVGRLLNLNDGFIGQGMKIATVISTNVNMESFNSAVTRPGRCLANIEFPKFTAEEASAWLGQHEMSTDQDMSLAEMYDHVRRTQAVRSTMSRFDTT